MRLLVDNHHGDLYWSFYLLFERRLGHEIFMPIGMAWWDEKYWDYGFHNLDVARQFLGEQRIVENLGDHCTVYDLRHDVTYKALTLEQFKAAPCDVLLSTMPQTDIGFDKLRHDHAPKAKRVTQIGNAAQYTKTPNVLVSALPLLQKHSHYVVYHQEFELSVFYPTPPSGEKIVRSFINALPTGPHWADWLRYKGLLPEYAWQSYGIVCPDGNVDSKHRIAELMRESMWGWQVKGHGDGYGHCYDDQTEVLTDDGWKLFRDLQPQNKVAALKDGKELVFEQPTAYQRYRYQGEMVQFNGKGIDLLVTPDHRMYVQRYDKNANPKGWGFLAAKDCNFMRSTYQPGRALGFKKAPDEWNGNRDVSIWWARFLGWYLAEGSYQTYARAGKVYRSVCIANTNLKRLAEIAEIVDRLGYHPGKAKNNVRVTKRSLYDKVVQFGKAEDKYIPREILDGDREILWAFLECYIKGDGHKESDSTYRITTISKKMADGLQECAIKLGFRTTVTQHNKTVVGNIIYRVTISNLRTDAKLYHVRDNVQYDGMVYCVTVPSGVILVRRNGRAVFCGNCAHNWIACGRPVITNLSYYRDKMAGQLYVDGVTCVDIDAPNPVERVRKFSGREEHLRLCENAVRRWNAVVDFAAEAEAVRRFMEELL